jgi:hypothetical protein
MHFKSARQSVITSDNEQLSLPARHFVSSALGQNSMLRLGIYTRKQYLRARARKAVAASAVSYKLLDIGDASETERQIFEEIQFRLRTSNGTFRTTFRDRFADVDTAAVQILQDAYEFEAALYVQDRAASHALTSCEWAERLFHFFPHVEFEASDRLLELFHISLSKEEGYIVEPDGKPLQWIRPPFVVGLSDREPLRYPMNHLIAARAARRFQQLNLADKLIRSNTAEGCQINRISCVHPRARSLNHRDPRFRLAVRSVFEITPGVDVLRTMNIFNRSYFSEDRLQDAVKAVYESLKPGGIWIVGRTLEHDFSNHVTFFRKQQRRWEVLRRVGTGWELEEVADQALSQAASGG